jgi:hypothetical protein
MSRPNFNIRWLLYLLWRLNSGNLEQIYPDINHSKLGFMAHNA